MQPAAAGKMSQEAGDREDEHTLPLSEKEAGAGAACGERRLAICPRCAHDTL
jgi:hypothetical protein